MTDPTIKIVNAQNVVIEYTRASLGNRIVARIIDLIVLYALLIVIILVSAATESWVFGGLLALPVIFFSFLAESLSNGQSPGKKAMNLRVIAKDGGHLTPYALLLRWVMLMIDLWLSQGVVGIISIVVSQKGQRLGDLAAGTLVISTQKKAQLSAMNRYISQPDYTVLYPESAALTDADIRTLREVLNNRKMHRSHFIALAARKVEEVLGIKARDNDARFLQKVVLDHAFLLSQATEEFRTSPEV